MGCFNDPAWKVCGWGGWCGVWLTPTTYIQLAGAGSKVTFFLEEPVQSWFRSPVCKAIFSSSKYVNKKYSISDTYIGCFVHLQRYF